MAGGVEEVQFDPVSILSPVVHSHRMGFDGDPTLSLKIHGVEKLILFFSLGNRLSLLKKTIRKSRLPVIDMRDDGKVPGQFDRHAIREEITLGPLPFLGSEKEGDEKGTLAQ